MAKTSVRTRVLVPLLAFVFAFAFAPAAFAAPQGNTNLESMVLQIQDDGDEADLGNNGIGPDLDRAVLTISNTKQIYTGKEIRPAFTVTLDGRVLKGSEDFQDPNADFFYFYMNNVVVGNSSTPEDDRPQIVLATFSGTTLEDLDVYIKQGFFDINPLDINYKDIKVAVANQTYTGKQLKPGVSVTYNGMTLKNGVDYSVSYGKNVKVGNGKVTITGKGNYTNKKTVTFKINKATINDAKFSKVKDQVYSGKAFTPNVKVKYKGKVLKKNKDYTIKYKHNKNAGIASIVIKGKKNLKGKHVIYFAIEPAPMSKCSASVSSQTWTGGWLQPTPSVKYKGMSLKKGKDFTVYYRNNSDIGTARVYIQGMGNYTGTIYRDFSITQRSLWDSRVNLSVNDNNFPNEPYVYVTYTYNGTRALVKDREYKFAWSDSTKDTTGKDGKVTRTTTRTITVWGIGNFNGTRTYTFKHDVILG